MKIADHLPPNDWILLVPLKANYVNFSFAFLPCHKVLPYEQATVSVFQSNENDTDVCQNGLEILKTKVAVVAAHLVNVRHNNEKSLSSAEVVKPAKYETEAVIAYQVNIFHIILVSMDLSGAGYIF